ncbi:MAG: hemolysin family protein [Acidimicrobiales bacterium]
MAISEAAPVSDVLTGLGLAVVVSILFVCRLIEVTFVRLGRARALGLDEADGVEGRLGPLVRERERLLGPVTLVRLTCQVVIIGTVAVAASNRLGPAGVALALAASAAGLYLIAEAVPRRIGLEANDQMARSLARVGRAFVSIRPLGWISRVFEVIAKLLGPHGGAPASSEVVEDELVAMAEAAAAADLIEHREASLIGSIIQLGDTIAREVMVPRPDMVTTSAASTVRQTLEIVVDSGFSRIPVTGDNSDDLLGMVLSKDLIAAHLNGHSDDPVGALARELMFVPETKRVTELMAEMQEAKRHLAVVVDEYGGTAGIVALEDIIEEMVGEIVDEFDDEVDLVQELEDGAWRVSGRLPIDDLRDLVTTKLPDGDWDTVAGLVFDLAGHVPEANEAVHCDGFEFVVEVVDARRIDVVRVVPGPPKSSGNRPDSALSKSNPSKSNHVKTSTN